MKRFIFKNIFTLLVLGVLFTTTSCENGEQDFADFDYQTVYFAYQTPIRTLTMGTDVVNTDLDNQHKCQLQVTMGGVWKNRQDRTVQLAVDNSLCDGKTFEDGTPIVAMPASYYTIANTTVTIKAGTVRGIAEVQLTDAFFADPQALKVHYVIPVRIVNAQDSILKDKDYTLYAVTYKNKWHGNWICHGTDEINLNGTKSTVRREAEYLEKNELRALSTIDLNKSAYRLSATVDVDTTITDTQTGIASIKKDKKTLTATLQLAFDKEGRCTISTNTPGCEVSGSGKWTFEGAKKAWADKDRDLLQLEYTLTFHYTDNGQPKFRTANTKETLVMQNRGNHFETFKIK